MCLRNRGRPGVNAGGADRGIILQVHIGAGLLKIGEQHVFMQGNELVSVALKRAFVDQRPSAA